MHLSFFMLSNPAAFAQDQGLSERGKAADKNNNGVIDRDEAGGPLKASFDDMDCNKSGTLDGGEIRGFFSGEECPKNVGLKSKVAVPVQNTVPPLSERGKAADKNNNGVIDRDEAGGPLKASFDDMDCNKSGTLDGGEIRGFFSGEECPKNVGVKSKVAEPLEATSQGGKSRSVATRARGVRVDAVIIEPFSQTSPVIGRLVREKPAMFPRALTGRWQICPRWLVIE